MPAFCIRAVYKLSYRGISSGEDGDWGGNVVWTCFERRLISFGRDEQRFLLFLLLLLLSLWILAFRILSFGFFPV